MKKIAIAFLAVFMLPCGCKVLKKKSIEQTFDRSRIENDVRASSIKIDSTKSTQATTKIKSTEFLDEEINIKNGSKLENITISANFKLDSGALLKDTIKLVDIKNNGVTLAIYQKGREVMATVTTPTSTHTAPFSEINIKRKLGKASDKVDSLASFENHSEIKKDSLDKTKIETVSTTKAVKKEKETKPDFWLWALGLALIVAVIYILIKRK